jgi:hypothetical protein
LQALRVLLPRLQLVPGTLEVITDHHVANACFSANRAQTP